MIYILTDNIIRMFSHQNALDSPFSQLKQIFLLTHQLKQSSQTIRIYTQMNNCQIALPNPQDILATIYIHTKQKVLEGMLLVKDINSQLAWSNESYTALIQSLSGKRANTKIKLIDGSFTLICQISATINVALFTIALRILPIAPYAHIHRLFDNTNRLYKQVQQQAKLKKQIIIKQIAEMKALEKQIQDQHQTQVSYMKNQFITIINGCKIKLRKHMKPNIEQDQQNQTKDKEGRIINKVDRKSLIKKFSTNSNEEQQKLERLFE